MISIDPTRKPPETYTLVENFCLGLRRLELFGRTHSLRPGWVTVGEGLDELDPELGAVKWEREWWDYHVHSITDMNGRHVVPTSAGTLCVKSQYRKAANLTECTPHRN